MIIEESDNSELEESSDADDYSSSDFDDEIILDELIPDAQPDQIKTGWIPVLEDENEIEYDFDNTICSAKHIRRGIPSNIFICSLFLNSFKIL